MGTAAVLLVFGVPGAAASDEMRQVLDSAWARDAEVAALTARRAEILARQRAAERLTPAPPALSVGHLSDYATGNDGYREYDVELGTPIWLPGEGTAARRVADAELEQLEAELAVARLEVTGTVRDAYWRVRLAAAAVEAARQRLDAARALQADLDRQVRAGQVARADLLLSVAETAEAQSILGAEEAALAQARLTFQAVAGVSPPVRFNEPEVPARAGETHPRRLALRKALGVFEATGRLLKVQDRDSPEIALLGVVERELDDDPYDKRVGLRVTLPFASEGRNQPRRAANEAERARALAALRALDYRIDAEVGRAQTELIAAERRLVSAGERHQAFAERLGLVQRGFRLGEAPLVELIRARADLFAADVARRREEIAVMQARSSLNQALGLSPLPPATEVRR
jgi:outer membrane protein TolC